MQDSQTTPNAKSLRAAALQALQITDFKKKTEDVSVIWSSIATYSVVHIDMVDPENLPGRPARPELFSHLNVPKRSPYTPDGLAALVHAVCHIEFNAINLALDAVWRFANMPAQYYHDWMRVAFEESTHFNLLREQLLSLGHDYGSFPAHNGLWDMTAKTQHDITARMALVPRTLEARGLDATPPMQAKLRKVGSPDALRTVAILDTILRDEVGHVAIGNHWYNWLCARDGHEPVAYFAQLLKRYEAPKMRPPFNLEARRRAGFSASELMALSE